VFLDGMETTTCLMIILINIKLVMVDPLDAEINLVVKKSTNRLCQKNRQVTELKYGM
jgi:hypothetical protein